jgi:hypothetical protein
MVTQEIMATPKSRNNGYRLQKLGSLVVSCAQADRKPESVERNRRRGIKRIFSLQVTRVLVAFGLPTGGARLR